MAVADGQSSFGQYCRRLQQVVVNGVRSQHEGAACLGPNGWQDH